MPTKRELERADKAFAFIEACWENHNAIPSQAELAEHLGVGVPAARDTLLLLEKQGRIEREPYVARSIRIVNGAPPVDGTVEIVYEYIRRKIKYEYPPLVSQIRRDLFLTKREVKRCLDVLVEQERILIEEG
ncbi:MAG: hypothetical protein AAF126_23335, partial [Chloroflexota bacterium]